MLKPGTKVTTEFIPEESSIVREIKTTLVIDNVEYSSATGGNACSSCGKEEGTPLPLILSKLYRRLYGEN